MDGEMGNEKVLCICIFAISVYTIPKMPSTVGPIAKQWRHFLPGQAYLIKEIKIFQSI